MNLKHPDRRRCLGSLLAAAWGLAGLSGLAAASSATAAPATPAWQPRRPITLWVPWAAGGATDLTLRLLAELAGQRLGQRIVIENRGGAGGTLAMPVLAQAAPDGHTLAQMPQTVFRAPWTHKLAWIPSATPLLSSRSAG